MIREPIIIAGGGIGGLAAALGLARAGWPSLVLEQASRFGEIGAGIQLGPNAFHAFDWLGVGNAMRATAVYVDHLILMDAMVDERITAIPLSEDFRKRFGNPYAVVHRADMHSILLKACRDSDLITLRTSAAVTGYRQNNASGVTATLAGGQEIAGVALIGADGLRSRIRELLANDGPPRVSGHTTYRSVIPTVDMPPDLRWNAATLWAGPKCHIVHYPLKGGEVFNLVVTCHNDAPEPVAGQPVSRDEVLKGFGHIAERPRRIIESGGDWKLWVLCDRDPMPTWQDGRVVLLGDAAHPMLQYLAQGACMALEDAVSLGHQVAVHGGDMEEAFRVYAAHRFLRTGRVQVNSRLIGDFVYHAAGGMAALRNATLAAASAEEQFERVAWLYGVNGLGEKV